MLHRFETRSTFSTTGVEVGSCQDNQNSQLHTYAFGNCLTQEEVVHRTQEAGGKAHPVGILGDGSQEVDLAFLVEQMASGVSQRQVDPLSQTKRMQVSNDHSRSKVLRVLYVPGGIIPIPRPAGIPRPGPAGS